MEETVTSEDEDLADEDSCTTNSDSNPDGIEATGSGSDGAADAESSDEGPEPVNTTGSDDNQETQSDRNEESDQQESSDSDEGVPEPRVSSRQRRSTRVFTYDERGNAGWQNR